MTRKPRIHYTETDKALMKALMWDRWRKGDSLEKIAQLFDRTHSSVGCIFRRTGGIRPPKRTRSRRALSLAEREEISRGVVAGRSLRSIAAALNRACKLGQNRALAGIVASKLQLAWSPRQIAGWLKRTYPDDETYQVSHETIYRTLFIQARGALKKELLQHLRRTRRMRRSRHHTQKTADHGRISDTVSIRSRGSRRTWSLGGRSLVRQQEQPDRNPGRTSYSLRDDRQGKKQRHRDGDQRTYQAGPQATQGALQVTHLGSRQRNGGSQTLHPGHGYQGLLLRSAESLAARFQRKHERPAQAVLPKGNGSVERSPEQVECGRQTAKRKAKRNVKLRNTS